MTDVCINKLKNIKFSKIKVKRAGFILYTLYNGNIYFMIGVDSKTHELTDFAGTINYKYDRNFLRGAIRELQEETLELFEEVNYNDIKECIVIYDYDSLVIFMPISLHPDIVCQEFNERYHEYLEKNTKKDEPEVCGITWLDSDEFVNQIKNKGIIYSRVRNLLAKAGNFVKLL